MRRRGNKDGKDGDNEDKKGGEGKEDGEERGDDVQSIMKCEWFTMFFCD